MVSMLTSNAVDCGFYSGQVYPKIVELVFGASLPSMQHWDVRSKTGWLRIRVMCWSGATCLPADCCFSELVLKNSTKCAGLIQS